MSELLKQNDGSNSFRMSRTRQWMIFAVILAIVGFVVFTSASDKIVIYSQISSSTPDYLQVFFPIGGVYSEKNSVKSELYEFFPGQINVIQDILPRKSMDHVRIDPGTRVGDVLITKIELRYLFGKETLMPKDILARAKPVQMIDEFDVTDSGLLIHSTSYDPYFELQINEPPIMPEYAMLGMISVPLSLIIFFIFRMILSLKTPTLRNRCFLSIIPLFTSLAVAWLFYPGFMSYDTLLELHDVRNGMTDSLSPPMVIYIWHIVDFVSWNPTAMHFSQVLLLLFAVFLIIFLFTKKIRYSTVSLFIYLCVPVILGTAAVIWKDVLMAAFFLTGFAAIVYAKDMISQKRLIFVSLLAVFLIFMGVCSRHNAIAGAVPLLFYLAWVICSRKFNHSWRLWLSVILLGSALTGSLFAMKTLLDNYSLPSFDKFSNSANEFTDVYIEPVRVFDVAGASLCVGSNLFGDMAPNLSLAEINSLYDPRHANLSVGLLDKVGIDSRINKIWLDVAIHHPICFFDNKFQLARYMLGANTGDQFLLTHNYLDENEYGYRLPESSLRDAVMSYITKASNLFFFRPWFLYLVSIVVLIYMAWRRILKAEYSILFLSALFYFAGLVALGNAADARLPFYTTSALLILLFVFISDLWKRFKGQSNTGMINFTWIYNNKYVQMVFEHERTGQFARYLFVGGTCAVLDLLLLYIFVDYLHIWYLSAATASFIITLALSYVGQKYFTFQDYTKNHKKQLPVFFIVAIIALVINAACMFIFVSWIGIWYMLASVITKIIVFIWNFIANQKLTFKK